LKEKFEVLFVSKEKSNKVINNYTKKNINKMIESFYGNKSIE